MRKVFLLAIIICMLITPVCASEIDISPPPAPDSAAEFMPATIDSFGNSLWHIVKKAVSLLNPSLASAAGVCLSLVSVSILVSVVSHLGTGVSGVVSLVATVCISTLLLQQTNALLQLGRQTVSELYEYGKLLLPVMTAAMAAEGGVTASASLYAGTALFSSILTSIITNFIIPMVYVFTAICICSRAVGQDILEKIKKFIKWMMTWSLKIVLYVFTGYMGITKVVSGTVDAAALKATKLTMSGFVPVIGGIISDASEAVLVSARLMKNAAGIYGMLAIIAVFIHPFLKIGIQYLLLKATASVCAMFGTKQSTGIIQDFSVSMGYILAMTGTVCVMLLISTVCFMKGIS